MSNNVYDYEAEHKTPWWKKKWVQMTVMATGIFVLGLGLGALTQPEPEQVVVAGPRVTLEPEPAVTVTSEPMTQVTNIPPSDCLALKDDAEVLLGLSYEYVSIIEDLSTVMADAVDAASMWDDARLNDATYEVSLLVDRMDDQQNVIDTLVAGGFDQHVTGCK